jgi:hypothetical protein
MVCPSNITEKKINMDFFIIVYFFADNTLFDATKQDCVDPIKTPVDCPSIWDLPEPTQASTSKVSNAGHSLNAAVSSRGVMDQVSVPRDENNNPDDTDSFTENTTASLPSTEKRISRKKKLLKSTGSVSVSYGL